LAEEACQIEIDVLGQPIGRQDQYAAAFGGVNSIRFGADGVEIESLKLSAYTVKRLGEELTLVFTGLSRSASEVLSEVPDDPDDKLDRLRAIRIQADEVKETLESGNLSDLGNLLNGAWEVKRGISAGVSGDNIDALHTRIMSMGATGAKLLGAGGGGFFLVHGEGGLRARLAELGPEHRIIPLGIDYFGSTIIHED
jgi:D-glycero-alpha-D-manno-heptose-7-phosphate kinase